MNDKIGDAMNRIKTAGEAGKETLLVPFSNHIAAILDVLQKEGFIKSYAKKGKKITRFIEVALVYVDGQPRINGVERLSRPSKRLYQGAGEIRSVRQGFGAMLISTPKGILTDKEAKKEKVGGEILFKIW
jgi:small subunit ribosomal protein S8